MTSIIAKYHAPALHKWPTAPKHRAYLRNSHRHMFTYVVHLEVKHDDRDVEFHDLQDWLAGWVVDDWTSMSCEQIAADMRSAVMARWPSRKCTVEVWEDLECGAIVDG